MIATSNREFGGPGNLSLPGNTFRRFAVESGWVLKE